MKNIVVLIAFLLFQYHVFSGEIQQTICLYGNQDLPVVLNNPTEGFSYIQKGTLDGVKYKLYVEKAGSSNEVSDHIDFTNEKDQTATYPLNCKF